MWARASALLPTGCNPVAFGFKHPQSESNSGPLGQISCFARLNRDYINRQSADLSADKVPDFSSFFIGRQKIIITTWLYFFSIGRQFLGFGNWPIVGRRSADHRPISRPILYLNEPLFIGRCVGRSSPDSKAIGRRPANDRPIVKFCG